jgi:Domain of unknown function (DUF4352)
MDALAGLLSLHWFILTICWIATFIGPTRRMIARRILAPRHLPLRRARWVVGIGALVCFVAFAIMAPPDDNQVQSVPSASASAGPEVAKSDQESAPRSDEGAKKVNEPFTLGNFAYQITGVVPESYLGNEFVNKSANQGSTYLIVSYDITNVGSETQTVVADDFELKTEVGLTYRPD